MIIALVHTAEQPYMAISFRSILTLILRRFKGVKSRFKGFYISYYRRF